MRTGASLAFAWRLLFPRTGRKSNARRSLIGACACIAISLVPLVMVLTVSDGMIQGITSRIIGLSSSHLKCVLYPLSKAAQDGEELRALAGRLSRVEGVTAAYPEVQGIGLAAGRLGRTGATVRAVRGDVFRTNPAFAGLFTVSSGVADLGQKDAAVIGERLAEQLGLSAGDTFRLITARRLDSGSIVPRVTPLRVAGVVSCGYQELDALWVFVPLETGFSVLSAQSGEVSVGIFTADAFDFPALSRAQGGLERAVPQYTRVYRWDELNAAQYENFSSTRIMLLFIMLLIVLVASVNVSSALVMLVMERRREIAILRSLGASAQGIALSFLVTGMVTGAAGVLAGIPAGLLCAVNFDASIRAIERAVNGAARFLSLLRGGAASGSAQIHLLDPAFYLQRVPLSVPLGQLIVIGCGTLVLSLAVSAVPAVRAGREKPIGTLRKI